MPDVVRSDDLPVRDRVHHQVRHRDHRVLQDHDHHRDHRVHHQGHQDGGHQNRGVHQGRQGDLQVHQDHDHQGHQDHRGHDHQDHQDHQGACPVAYPDHQAAGQGARQGHLGEQIRAGAEYDDRRATLVAAAAEWKDDPRVRGHQELRANQVVAPSWEAFPEATDGLV